MQIQKLKLATYAIGKRLQGYHLLRNPKTSSPLELTMIRRTYKDVLLNGDIFTWYDRVSRDFGKKTKPLKETLITRYYYSNSPESKIEPYKRYINLSNGRVKSKVSSWSIKTEIKIYPCQSIIRFLQKPAIPIIVLGVPV